MHLSSIIFKINTVKLCIIALTIDIIITVIFSVILFPEPKYGNNILISSLIERVILLIILAPIIETYVFQKLFLDGAVMLTKERIFSSVFVALLFGFAHWYSIPYIIKAFFAGLLYNSLYLIVKERGQNAFLYTAFTHMSFNLFALIINELVS